MAEQLVVGGYKIPHIATNMNIYYNIISAQLNVQTCLKKLIIGYSQNFLPIC